MLVADGRKIDRKTLEEIRITAIIRVLNGESPETVIRDIGFSRTVIYEWLKKIENGGIERLKRRKAPGRTPKLRRIELNYLYYEIVTGQKAMWNRNMVGEYIYNNCGVTLSSPAIRHQLEKLGLVHKRTTKNLNPANENIVRKWIKDNYLVIRNDAKVQNAEIWFLGISKLRAPFHRKLLMIPKPIKKEVISQATVNVIAGIKPNNVSCFLAEEDRLRQTSDGVCGENAEISTLIIDFVNLIIHRTNRHVILIVQRDVLFRQSSMQEFIKNYSNKFSIEYLPSNFPRPRDDEHIWSYLKGYVM